MLKLIILGRRASGKSRRAAQDHLKMVHGRMVVCPPADAGAMPARYVQNHVIDGIYPSGSTAHGVERDLVTELWFDDFDHLRGSTSTPYYLDNLKPDEPRFVDDSSVAKMVVRPEVMVEGERGTFKVFLAAGSASDALDQLVTSARGIGGSVRNVALPPPDGSAPFVPLIYEAWFEALDDAYALLDSFAVSLPADAAHSFAVVAEQYDSARLAKLF